MQKQKTVQVKLTSTAYKTLKGIQKGYPIIVNEGGSSSGKSFGTMQILISVAINNPQQRISVVSHSLPHLKRGCIRDFEFIMKQQLNLYNEDEWSATNFKYTYKNGSYIEFVGLEDEGKARGPRRDYLFVNEGNLISKQLFDQLAMRTAKCSIVDLNPADFNCWCYEVADNPINLKIHSTYLDNIENLSQNQINYIEAYKNLADDFMWKVYGLGQRGAAKELIYTNWKTYNEQPNSGEVIYGLDFGYTAPMAMTKVTIYDNSIYVEEILYKSGLTISDLGGWLKTLNLGRKPIYCDAAEPKSIEELSRYGFNCQKADKDVWAGILKVKSMPIHLHFNSKNLISEVTSYKWKKDNNDNILEEPVKMHDHLCDSFRYAVFTHLTKPKLEWLII
jgi:phage terminase large subunit